MSETDTGGGDDPETTTVNLRLTEAFLEDVDATWRDEGYNSRSEFIRHAVRDAVEHPEFSRGAWKDVAATEYARRTRDVEMAGREDVRERMERKRES